MWKSFADVRRQNDKKRRHSSPSFLAHDSGYALLKMPPTEIRKVSLEAWASIGQVSNEEYKLRNFGKARPVKMAGESGRQSEAAP